MANSRALSLRNAENRLLTLEQLYEVGEPCVLCRLLPVEGWHGAFVVRERRAVGTGRGCGQVREDVRGCGDDGRVGHVACLLWRITPAVP